jgi:DNA modification methylase
MNNRVIAPIKPYYEDDQGVTLYHGDCIEVMRALPDSSVHAIVTDPPYGLGFMGKAWDGLPPGLDFAVEAFRVLKPGGHILAFGGSRTWHRLAVAIEDAGFEIRDSIAWLYGSGFPKSMDVSKAIDKAAGAQREVVGTRTKTGMGGSTIYAQDAWTQSNLGLVTLDITAPATVDAQQWEGWGTALKPAFEPIVVGRKPLAGTVAANAMMHGTGALNIDACRVATDEDRTRPARTPNSILGGGKGTNLTASNSNPGGRFPTNVLLEESQAVVLDKESGILTSGMFKGNRNADKFRNAYGDFKGSDEQETYGDSGGASRFFPTFHYEAKAPTSERPDVGGVQHPTVKPLDLMRWLVRLVASPGSTILEPFAGSGTTLEACLVEGFNVIGIEREETYLPLIMQRITKPLQQSLFGDEVA